MPASINEVEFYLFMRPVGSNEFWAIVARYLGYD
jgi:hypothetical protein